MTGDRRIMWNGVPVNLVYSKALVALLTAVVSAAVALFVGTPNDPIVWVNVAVSVAGAVSVYLAGNQSAGGLYTKALLAGVTTVLTAELTLLAAHPAGPAAWAQARRS